MAIKTEPPSSVLVGNTFGLTVQVEDSLGNAVSGGTVRVALGSNNPGDATLGGTLTEPVVNGLATFSDLTLSQPGTGYTLTVTDSGIAGAQTTTSITVSAGGNATKVVVTASPAAPVFGQTVTLYATVSIVSPGTGVPTGTVIFKEGSTTLGTATLQGGAAKLSTTPLAAEIETITIAYGGDANDQSSKVDFPLTVGQATPTLTWADPANITVGTPLGDAQLDATASFDGMPLPGELTYTPAAGTVLPTGNGQILTVSFTPVELTDFKSVTSSVLINVLPKPTPPVAMVTSEQPVFRRKLKNGKPVGKAVLTGFTLDFNMSLGAAAASNPRNYQLGIVTTKKVKKQLEHILEPIKSFTVRYTRASDSVTFKLASAQSFPLGGQLRVLPGVTSASGSVLSGTTVFTITPGGKEIGPS